MMFHMHARRVHYQTNSLYTYRNSLRTDLRGSRKFLGGTYPCIVTSAFQQMCLYSVIWSVVSASHVFIMYCKSLAQKTG